MSITDELREWAVNHRAELDMGHLYPAMIEGIADRIDAKHVSICCGYQREHDDWVHSRDTCWVELPKDADGVPIHIGDRVENNERVVRIVLTDESWEPSVYIEKLPNVLHEYFCNEISHYHEPTVEDVLAEFFEQVGDGLHTLEAMDTQLIIAKYAAKLRLAGDGEEQ